MTFHETIANVYGFDEKKPGSAPIEDLIEGAGSQLSELRGMMLANGFLYVVNGGSSVSNILCCTPDTKKPYHYQQKSVFVSSTLAAISHPFDCTFQVVETPALPSQKEMQTWYVSNQDTNVVAVLTCKPPYDSAEGSSTSAYLTAVLAALEKAKSKLAKHPFLPSTFVPTALVEAEIPKQPTVDPSWGGLTPVLTSAEAEAVAAKKPKVQNSVRGVAVHAGVLYVADEGGNAVRMYDPVSGVPLGSSAVPGPVHLLVQDGTLYVTSGDSVLYGACVAAPATPPVPPPVDQFSHGPVPPPYPAPPAGYTNSVTLKLSDLGLNLPKGSGPSGLTFDSLGNLYVGLRKTSEIYGFAPNPAVDGKAPASPFSPAKGNPIFTLQDQPEFLLWIANQ